MTIASSSFVVLPTQNIMYDDGSGKNKTMDKSFVLTRTRFELRVVFNYNNPTFTSLNISSFFLYVHTYYYYSIISHPTDAYNTYINTTRIGFVIITIYYRAI